MTIFLDTNIVVALLNPDEQNHEWAVDQLASWRVAGPTIISDIVYCETSVTMESLEELDQALGALGLERMPESDPALFRAGRAYHSYKTANRGPKDGVLPDFLIGALAEVSEARLATDDIKRYRTYFPDLALVNPPRRQESAE